MHGYQSRPTIRAELASSDHATAFGTVARGNCPVLTLCRKLVEAGYDPATPLEAWRAGTLCLRVRSIGKAAGLEINAHGSGFIAARGRRAPSPMRQIPESEAPPTGWPETAS